jgi:hypothetical protein
MAEPFSQEDRIEAGNAVLNVLDSLEDQDLQRHLVAFRTAADEAASNLTSQGFTPKVITQVLIGVLLASTFYEDR